MKTALSISLSFCLILSIFVISTSATEITDVINSKWVIQETPSLSSDFSWHIDFYSRGEFFDYLYIPANHNIFYFHSYTTGQYVTVYSSSLGWVDEEYRTIDIVGGDTTDSIRINAFSHIADFVRFDDTPLVSTGVSSSLGFFGQVLNFITSSQGILTLLGLSIALFLVVPFAITKLKDLVKGY